MRVMGPLVAFAMLILYHLGTASFEGTVVALLFITAVAASYAANPPETWRGDADE